MHPIIRKHSFKQFFAPNGKRDRHVNEVNVYLVGAGPGDLGLVTVKARQLIASCDVVVYDYLVNPKILDWVKPGCECIDVGKRPNWHAIPQPEIEDILIERARQGLKVVRLKGGDPFVFGRGGEEAQRLQDHGLTYEIVPGVTAALGSAAYAGIPLTHREHSSSICFLTGHEDPEKHVMHVDFQHFAKTQGTLCIYMGMGHLDYIVSELIKGGRTVDTAVAVVQWATLAKQRSVVGTLDTIVEQVEHAGLSAPAVIIVGEVAQFKEVIGWHERRPLYGKRVAVTRNKEQAGKLSERLEALGAEVLELPLIEVSLDYDPGNLEDVFAEIATYEWIVFTSPNGVRYFFELFFQKFKDLRCLGLMRIACIGPATAKAVEAYHLEVDFIPETAVAEELVTAFLKEHDVENQNLLVITGNRNRDVLVKKLEEDGRAIVDTLRVYKTEPSHLADHPDARRFCAEGAHAITFTSASTVQSFVDQVQHLQMGDAAQRPKGISIGPITSEAMKVKGLPVDAQAREHTIDGLVAAVLSKLSEA